MNRWCIRVQELKVFSAVESISLFCVYSFIFFLPVRSIHHFYLYCFVTILFEKKAFNLLLMAYE